MELVQDKKMVENVPLSSTELIGEAQAMDKISKMAKNLTRGTARPIGYNQISWRTIESRFQKRWLAVHTGQAIDA